MAYEIYIPIGLAGFGLTSGFKGLFPQGLEVVGLWLAWVILIGTFFLAILKLRPTTFFGYLLTAVILAAALYSLLTNSAFGAALQSQMHANEKGMPAYVTSTINFNAGASDTTLAAGIGEASPTPTLTPVPGTVVTRQNTGHFTPTNTLVPTNTSTVTITPKPTPVYALVYTTQSESVVMRKTADGDYLTLLKVNTLVEVLGTTEVNNRIWVHVRVAGSGSTQDQDGWIAQSLLQTATPMPNG